MATTLKFVLRAKDLENKIRVDLLAEGGEVRSDLQRRARNVRNRAKELLATRSDNDTGSLASTIRYVTVDRGKDGLAAQVGSDDERAIWVEEGTGVFGPHGTPIVPSRAPLLVFENSAGQVFRLASVEGQRGKHYLRDALDAAAP
jgi:hypothetical protein